VKATAVPVNVPFLTALVAHVGPPVNVIEVFPESESGEKGPEVSSAERVAVALTATILARDAGKHPEHRKTGARLTLRLA
jgi:hypothetical protein